MTLAELANTITIDSQIVDVYTWNDDKNEYDFLFGFENDGGDLGGDLLYIEDDMRKFIAWEVRWIGAEILYGKAILRIELQEPEA